PRCADPGGQHPDRPDDAEPPGRVGAAGEDALRDLRAAGEHHHRNGRAAACAARSARGLALGAHADRLPRASSGGAGAGEASMRRSASTSLALVALACAGCLGSSPASRFYTLSTLSPREGQGGGGGGAAGRVRVAPVTLPGGVDRPQLVRRTGENT